MEGLARLSHRMGWLNPLKQDPAYEPLARGMAAVGASELAGRPANVEAVHRDVVAERRAATPGTGRAR